MFTSHPQIRQRKQGCELRSVFHQSAVTQLCKTEFALDHSERVLDFGSDAGFSLLDGVEQGTDVVLSVKTLALAGHHGDFLFDVDFLSFRSILNAPVSGIGPNGGVIHP